MVIPFLLYQAQKQVDILNIQIRIRKEIWWSAIRRKMNMIFLKLYSQEDTSFISTSSGSDDGEGYEESVEKEIHSDTCQVAPSELRAWDSLNKSNKSLYNQILNLSNVLFIERSEGAENKSNPSCDDQQSSPDRWNFSPHTVRETELQVTEVEMKQRSLLRNGEDRRCHMANISQSWTK